jgi:hypothetical protein
MGAKNVSAPFYVVRRNILIFSTHNQITLELLPVC